MPQIIRFALFVGSVIVVGFVPLQPEISCAQEAARLIERESVALPREASPILVSPDGRYALAIHSNGHCLLFDLAKRLEASEFEQFDQGPRTSAFARDSSMVAYWIADRIVIRSVPSGREIRSIRTPKYFLPMSCVFSPDGDWIAVGGNGPILLIDVHQGGVGELRSGHFSRSPLGHIRRVDIAPNGALIASCSDNGYRPVALLDRLLRERIRDLEGLVVVDILAPDGRRIAVQNQNLSAFVDTLFSPDRVHLLALTRAPDGKSCEIWQWQTATGHLVRKHQIRNMALDQLSFLSNDGRWIAGVGVDASSGPVIALIDGHTGDVVDLVLRQATLEPLGTATALSPGRLFVREYPDTNRGRIVSWELQVARKNTNGREGQ